MTIPGGLGICGTINSMFPFLHWGFQRNQREVPGVFVEKTIRVFSIAFSSVMFMYGLHALQGFYITWVTVGCLIPNRG